jgi:aminoglycoside 3-N-acetyltransferase
VSRTIERAEFARALTRLGVADHKLVVVVSDLAAFGELEHEGEGREAELGGYVECFRELMQGAGTLVVPTFTYVRGGAESPYVHEETPSETGVLTEYMRQLPDSARSLHPVFSFAAIGEGREAICANVSGHSYGWNSMSHRLVEADALVVSIGRSPHRGSFFIHLGEVFAGVPYRYTKQLTIPVQAAGQWMTQPFFHFVKYADSDIAWDTNRLVERLERRGQINYEALGLSGIWAYKAKDMFNATVSLLTRNVYGLLAHPPTKTPWTR